jgi:hypothetical protein
MIEVELSKWTGFEWEYDECGKHPKVVVRRGDQRRICPFSKTKVGGRGMLNNVMNLKRVLREVGAVRVNN